MMLMIEMLMLMMIEADDDDDYDHDDSDDDDDDDDDDVDGDSFFSASRTSEDPLLPSHRLPRPVLRLPPPFHLHDYSYSYLSSLGEYMEHEYSSAEPRAW